MRINLSAIVLGVAALSFSTAYGDDIFTPVSPGNLKATVSNGTIVNLTWEWGNAGEAMIHESFEGEDFPENWQTSDNYAPLDETSRIGNWMIYDFSEEERNLAHDGVKGAVVTFPTGEDFNDPELYHQDEWLVVAPGEGAVYMDFWYYLYPELLEVGSIKEFPDHYYVMISRDNGETWTELWDGRWDMGPVDDVQQASLFLGDPADEDTLVAFRAVSAAEDTLYFTWLVDDISFYSAEEAASRSLKASSAPPSLRASATKLGKMHRKFEAPENARRVARIPEPGSEWLNEGNITYRVYLDGEIIGDYLKKRYFTDYSTKTTGTHTYKVVAWMEAGDEEFEAATIDVDTQQPDFKAPRNLRAYTQENGNGKYTIGVAWDAPEGDYEPTLYTVYVNDKRFAEINLTEEPIELEVAQSGVYKGYYTFGVEAYYTMPEGTSERVFISTTAGTKPAPEQLQADVEGSTVNLTWKHSTAEGPEPTGYTLSRGGKVLLASTTDFSFTDTNVADGNYEYNVRAIYDDGEVSLPAKTRAEVGTPAPLPLPYTQEFESEDTPDGWNMIMSDAFKTVKEMYGWRFDNWFDMELPEGTGITGRYASISGVAAGMNRLGCYLETPEFAIPAEGAFTVAFDQYFKEEKAGPSGPASLVLQFTEDDENWIDVAETQGRANGRQIFTVETTSPKGRLRWGFLGRMSGEAAIDNVKLSAGNGVTAVTEESVVDVYTIDGLKAATGISGKEVKNLPKGIYLIRTKDSCRKQIVK